MKGRPRWSCPPAEVYARVEGWLSNSKVAVHANPRRSEGTVDGASGPVGPGRGDPLARRVAPDAASAWSSGSGPARRADHAPARGGDPEPLARLLTIEPGGLLRARLRLEHQHCLYGEYDPLLGRRELELRLGPATGPRRPAAGPRAVPGPAPKTPGPSRPRTTRTPASSSRGPTASTSRPTSRATSTYRFPERKVRYSSRMRLRFWYMIAPGTEGEFKARVAQYRESPNAWKVLSDGGLRAQPSPRSAAGSSSSG